MDSQNYVSGLGLVGLIAELAQKHWLEIVWPFCIIVAGSLIKRQERIIATQRDTIEFFLPSTDAPTVDMGESKGKQ